MQSDFLNKQRIAKEIGENTDGLKQGSHLTANVDVLTSENIYSKYGSIPTLLPGTVHEGHPPTPRRTGQSPKEPRATEKDAPPHYPRRKGS